MYSASIKMSVYDNNDNDEELAENASNGKICVNKLNNSYTKYFDYDKLNKLLDIRFKNVEDRIVVSESGNTKKLKKDLNLLILPTLSLMKCFHVLISTGLLLTRKTV